MEKARGDSSARDQFRRVIHRDKRGVFLGSDVYPPPGVRVTRFGFRRVDRPNGQVAWRHSAAFENEPPAQRLLAWLDQLVEVRPLTFMTAYELAKLADAATGVIRGTQSHLAGLIGVTPRTLRAVIRTLRRGGHVRINRGAMNTYTLILKRAAGDASAGAAVTPRPPAADNRVAHAALRHFAMGQGGRMAKLAGLQKAALPTSGKSRS
jgi:hypothetical protein